MSTTAKTGREQKVFYGWVVVVACFAITATLSGVSYCFGVFLKSLEIEFNLSRAVISSIFSTNMVFYGFFAVMGGGLLDRSGPRIVVLLMGLLTGVSLFLTSRTGVAWQLFLTYGVLLAMGTGPGYTVVMGTTSRWFNRKRGLALGIVGSAAGFGTLVGSPVVGFLIQQVGWRTAYIVMGVFTCAVVIPASRLVRKDPAEIGEFPDGSKSDRVEINKKVAGVESIPQIDGFSLREASRTGDFWLFGSIWFLASSCYFLALTHIVPHATDMGISALRAAAILSLIGGGNVIGKLVLGRISDTVGRKMTAVLCVLAGAGVMAGLSWSEHLVALYLCGFVWGFSFGGFDTAVVAMVGDIFGLRRIGVIMGTLCIPWGIGAAAGSTLGGLIFDFTHTYFIAFLAGAIAMLALALLIALVAHNESRTVTETGTSGLDSDKP